MATNFSAGKRGSCVAGKPSAVDTTFPGPRHRTGKKAIRTFRIINFILIPEVYVPSQIPSTEDLPFHPVRSLDSDTGEAVSLFWFLLFISLINVQLIF